MASVKLAQMLIKPRNVALFTSGLLLVKILPEVFPEQMTRPFFQAYKNGRIRSVKTEQLEVFQEVCTDLEVEANKHHLFVTGRWEIQARGVAGLPNGVHFGIPINFVENPSVTAMRFESRFRENMKTKEGKSFQDSFNLSKSARKFALAVEVARMDSGMIIAKACLFPMFFLTGYATSFGLLPSLNFLPKPVSILAIGSFYFIAYRFCLGRINESIDLTLDKKVASLNSTYAHGGLEYYEKRLQRNIALRFLLEKGKKLFSYYGNTNSGMFYSSHAPLTERKDVITKIVEKNNKHPI